MGKNLTPVTPMLRELRVRLVIYIDNVTDTAEQARDHTLSLIYPVKNLGFIIHL